MRVQVPVYPPSSTVVLFHLQLKTLLVPPQGAFSRRCLRSHAAACLPPLLSLSLSVLRFFPSFFSSSPSPYPPLPSPSVFRAGHAPFVVAPRARLHSSCSPSSRASSRGVVSSAVSVRTLRLDRAAQNPTARMREVVASAGESLPRVTSRLYPAPRLYVYIYV